MTYWLKFGDWIDIDVKEYCIQERAITTPLLIAKSLHFFFFNEAFKILWLLFPHIIIIYMYIYLQKRRFQKKTQLSMTNRRRATGSP